MVDPTKEVKRGSTDTERITRNQVLQAIVFGLIFGFLLQKGGVAKFHVLIGSLLLQDFTVFKVMGSAIIVAMLGIIPLADWCSAPGLPAQLIARAPALPLSAR
jgi:hypothetical protein